MMSVPPRELFFSASLHITQHLPFFQQSDIIHSLTIECLLTACQSARVCLCACVHTLKDVEVEETVTRLQEKKVLQIRTMEYESDKHGYNVQLK